MTAERKMATLVEVLNLEFSTTNLFVVRRDATLNLEILSCQSLYMSFDGLDQCKQKLIVSFPLSFILPGFIYNAGKLTS